MPIVKSGNNIIVQADVRGATLSDVVTAINDTAYIEETAPGHFQLKGNRFFYVYGELIMGDPNDFSVSETLELTGYTSNGGARLYFPYQAVDSHFAMYGDCTIDLGHDPARYPYWYSFGNMTIVGDETYKPKIRGGYYLNWYPPLFTSNEDQWDSSKLIMRHVEFLEKYKIPSSYHLYWNSAQGAWRTWAFEDCLFDFNPGVDHVYGCLYAIFWPTPGAQDWSRYIFERCTFTKAYYPILGGTANCVFKDCTFEDNYAQIRINEACADRPYIHTENQDAWEYAGQDYNRVRPQRYAIFDGCTIRGGYNNTISAYAVVADGGGVVFLTGCDITSGLGQYALYTNTRGRIFLHGDTNTIACGNGVSTPCFNSLGGATFKAYLLDLTITDQDGAPVEGASVVVEHSLGYEAEHFITDENGKPLCNYHLGKIVCTYAEGNKYLVPTNPDHWTAWGGEHVVKVVADGYLQATESYTMDQDRVDTIALIAGAVPTTVEAKTLELESSWA
jgi:hypothetical protein